MRVYKTVVSVFVAAAMGGCVGHAELPPVAPLIQRTEIPLLLAGQSNALFLAPYVSLPLEPNPVVAENGIPIGEWQTEKLMWRATERALREFRVGAVVWWQGESDARNAKYLGDLRDLAQRMRDAAGDENLRIVVVRVLDRRRFRGVRSAQEAFVAQDRNAVLVSSDGLGNASSDHLTHRGYLVVAERIRRALNPMMRSKGQSPA